MNGDRDCSPSHVLKALALTLTMGEVSASFKVTSSWAWEAAEDFCSGPDLVFACVSVLPLATQLLTCMFLANQVREASPVLEPMAGTIRT